MLPRIRTALNLVTPSGAATTWDAWH